MLFFVELTPRMQTTFPTARAFGIKICHRAIRLHGVRRQSEAATALWIGVPRLRGSSGEFRLKAELRNYPKHRRHCVMPARSISSLDVEVQRKFPRMWPQTDRVDFFLSFVSQPRFDHVRREDSAFEQKIVILFQRIERLFERTRH